MKRFDRILWQINGILLLIATVSGVVLLVFGFLATMLFDSSSERKDADAAMVNVDKNTNQKEQSTIAALYSTSTGKQVREAQLPMQQDN
jgi:heme/copper-type cytochrome/quinol oxidase subunit 2